MSAYFPPHFSTLHFWTALSRAFKSVTGPMQRKAFQFQLILPPHPQVFRPPAYLGHLENNFYCWRRKNFCSTFWPIRQMFWSWDEHTMFVVWFRISPLVSRSPRGHCRHNCFDKLNSKTIIPFLPNDQNSRFMHTKRAKSSHSTCQAQHTLILTLGPTSFKPVRSPNPFASEHIQ